MRTAASGAGGAGGNGSAKFRRAAATRCKGTASARRRLRSAIERGGLLAAAYVGPCQCRGRYVAISALATEQEFIGMPRVRGKEFGRVF
jgi:hypothetical protein